MANLYVFHHGYGMNGELWYSVFDLDSSTWSPDRQVRFNPFLAMPFRFQRPFSKMTLFRRRFRGIEIVEFRNRRSWPSGRRGGMRGARRVERVAPRVALAYHEPSTTEVASVYRLPTIRGVWVRPLRKLHQKPHVANAARQGSTARSVHAGTSCHGKAGAPATCDPLTGSLSWCYAGYYVRNEIRCSNCGHLLSPAHVGPCPECGGTAKNVYATALVQAHGTAHVETTVIRLAQLPQALQQNKSPISLTLPQLLPGSIALYVLTLIANSDGFTHNLVLSFTGLAVLGLLRNYNIEISYTISKSGKRISVLKLTKKD
jgi:hypothetical protein